MYERAMHGKLLDPAVLMAEMGRKARDAAALLARMPSPRKAEAVLAAAAALRVATPAILAANAIDIAAGEAKGLSGAMLDRLLLSPERIETIAQSLEAVAAARDPVGMAIDDTVRPNGLRLTRLRIPIGVIGIIYESRPNVTADAAALCLKSGNAVILRGGSEASNSNHAIHAVLTDALSQSGMPDDAVQLVATTDRAVVGAMLTATGLIDLIIPRGGKSLTSRVQSEARVPVLAHLDGICHTYVDKQADPEKAQAIVVNAKMRRTGVCGALETLLIDRAYPFTRQLLGALIDAGCALRATAEICAIERRCALASQSDFGNEFLEPICAVRFVDGVDEAVMHIATYGSSHTDVIITDDLIAAEQFLATVDSAIVMHNTSSQFADGGEFGLGAEIGIATGRLHARGPFALEALTTYKWIVRGDGQIRP